MEVKELIELLSKLDQEEEILISTKKGEAYGITKIEYDDYLNKPIIKKR